jgi:arylsulfatase A-like enzyme
MSRKNLLLTAGSLAALVAAAVAVVLLLPASPWRADKVILITIDTLRADRLGCYGYTTRPTSPNLDAWAKEAVLFENAFSQAPWTVPSLGSIMTDRYPIEVGVYTNRCGISPDLETLPELFRQNGFRTASFNTHVLLTNHSGGFRRGFDEVHPDRVKPARPNQHKIPWTDTEPALMRWLDRHGSDRFFIWIHDMDPHAPPTVGNPYLEDRKWGGYDGEVKWVDEAIGRIRAKLTDLGIWNRALIVFTADHGEAFGEHKLAGHQNVMYDEVLHVPLIIQYPAMGGARRIREPVASLDIFPTIVELAGLPPPPITRGESLVPLIEGRRARRKASFIFHSRYHFEDGHDELAVRNRDWKLLLRTPDLDPERPQNRALAERRRPEWRPNAPHSRVELFEWSSDPAEKANLTAKHPEILAQLRHALGAWDEELSRADGQPRRQAPELDENSLEALRALGYGEKTQRPGR